MAQQSEARITLPRTSNEESTTDLPPRSYHRRGNIGHLLGWSSAAVGVGVLAVTTYAAGQSRDVAAAPAPVIAAGHPAATSCEFSVVETLRDGYPFSVSALGAEVGDYGLADDVGEANPNLNFGDMYPGQEFNDCVSLAGLYRPDIRTIPAGSSLPGSSKS
jgi:hypothetical protein